MADLKAPDGLDSFVGHEAPASDAPPGLDEFIAPELREEKYSTAGQQLKTAAEGIAQGIAGPLATLAETKVLGVNPEEMRAREEINPGIHVASEIAGFAGPALVSGGASALGKLGVSGAAKVASTAAKVGEATQAGLITKAASAAVPGFVKNEVGKDAIKGAFEAALFQGNEELSRKFKEDPVQTAESAIADIGLAGVMGGVFGGAVGAGLRAVGAKAPEESIGKFVSQVDREALEAGNFEAVIRHADDINPKDKSTILGSLKALKPNAGEIKKAANANGWPILEGMVAKHELVQRAEDSLIRGSGTFSGLRRKALYDEAYGAAASSVDHVLGEESKYTKAELGNLLKDSVAKDLKEESAPITALYDEIKKYQDVIPLDKGASSNLAKSLEEIKELRLAPKSPEALMVRRVLDDLDNLKTVDDIKTYKQTIGVAPTAPSNEKRIAGILRDKLTAMEEEAIDSMAEHTAKSFTEIMGPEVKANFEALKHARKEASSKYKGFIGKVQTLAEQLGKGRVYGLQDALHFIDNLTPEQVTNRLFSKNNSEFLHFFEKNFPEQMQHMRSYQKGVMREAATKEDVLSPKRLFTAINKLEPEVQKTLFSAEELKTLKQAETYLNSFPKNFNPSGTANAMDLRSFFDLGKAAATNARDLGIEAFIKVMGNAPEARNAAALAKATLKGEQLAARSVKALFESGKEGIPTAIIPLSAHRDKLLKQVEEYKANPDKMVAMNDSNPIPEYSVAFSATAMRAMQYIASIQPDNTPKNPLDSPLPFNAFQIADYERALDIAQKPLSIVHKMKNNTMVPKDIIALRSIYPSVYKNLSDKMMSQMVTAKAKKQTIPYGLRMQVSMFLGQPMDSSMTPMSIQSVQMAHGVGQSKAAAQQGPGPKSGKHTTSGLDKLAESAMTSGQARQKSLSK